MVSGEVDKKPVNELLPLLRHKEVETRWKAARALGVAGTVAVEPLLSQIYDDDPAVRILSIWALGRIRDKRAVEPITRSLHDENFIIRMASEGALSRITKF
jgi:HEAT repeat protein